MESAFIAANPSALPSCGVPPQIGRPPERRGVDVRFLRPARAALAGSPDGRGALRRYLHVAIDNGLGAVNIVHPLLDDHDWPDRRQAAEDLLGRLVTAAGQNREISTGVSPDEIALAAIRFCRPLAVGLDPARDRSIAHHQLDCYLDGLAARR